MVNIYDVLFLGRVIFGHEVMSNQGYYNLGEEPGAPINIYHVVMIKSYINYETEYEGLTPQEKQELEALFGD